MNATQLYGIDVCKSFFDSGLMHIFAERVAEGSEMAF